MAGDVTEELDRDKDSNDLVRHSDLRLYPADQHFSCFF